MPAVHLRDPTASAALALWEALGGKAGLPVDGRFYGVYELPAPQRDATGALIGPPYVLFQVTPNPDVRFSSKNRRAMAEVELAVRAVGPDAQTPLLRRIAVEIDKRLEDFGPAAGSDGVIILDCLRGGQLYYSERAGDTDGFTRHIGGLYVMHIA